MWLNVVGNRAVQSLNFVLDFLYVTLLLMVVANEISENDTCEIKL